MFEILASKVKVIVTDVDGVLTDGYILIDENGNEPFGKFSIYDGFGIVMAHACGIKIIVISGRQSKCTEVRCRKLGIDEVYTGVHNKSERLKEIANRLNLNFNEMAYIGDDLIDLGAMSLVGFKVAPQNAVQTIKDYVDYVTKAYSGDGALRELVDLILKSQNLYDEYVKQFFNL
ncbi:MAG: 3-deoxy-manno-octulosonate-8-phosphatase [Burkholderiales bacterium]|jgi:3-deoxy-D-manno-octulosonate 8-phosphate phosphatase (KDO 8-P phosphatase)|nr:3-deoxy-manno-octulosonate-8-phosphatase [Burkholderiales bacterium]MCE3269067.1 3-deoxy-manno-octulosonate-8-phosphatase [Burkholderiales bacterium]